MRDPWTNVEAKTATMWLAFAIISPGVYNSPHS